MCGFVVAFQKKLEKIHLEHALSSIRHRGPDDQGIWQNKEKNISFGHVRLSIIDLVGGIQPLSNHDESLIAVVNGEFYDYQRIRQDLIDDGYHFKTSSDSEIILGLYERFGVRALRFLRGEFAFVLWDYKNHLIFAARDYFGIKPLFYIHDSETIYFASEAKAFKALQIPLSFDEENFFHTICMFPNPEESLFAGVKQIPPAYYLAKSLFSSSIKLQSYWDFNYPKQHSNISEKEAALGLHDILNEAIKFRLRADVPVACYLSGGLDSCSILGFAQKQSPTPIQSFTLTFDHEDYDEAQQAQEMAQMVGSPFNPIPITQQDVASSFEDAVWHAERFLINGHAVAKFLLSRAVRNAGIKVVLTGEGSDEIFGGYAHFRQDQILQNAHLSQHEKTVLLEHLRDTNKVSKDLLLGNGINEDFFKAVVQQVGFLPGFMQSFSFQRSQSMALMTKDLINRYCDRNVMTYVLNFLDIEGQVNGRDYLSRSLYLWSKLFLPYYLLTVLGDRMEMAHSVEGRVPFLDHKVVEYVVSLPSEFKIKDLKEKYILREAAKPYITKTIYERQKHPFLAPPVFLSKKNKPMVELLQDTLRGQELKKIPLIDHHKVINLLDRCATMSNEERVRLDALLLSLLSACFLYKRMVA